MAYDPMKHSRRSIRLPGHDYRSPGAYFVTICVRGGECLLGEIADGDMRLNEWGQVARHCWMRIPDHFDHVQLDVWMVMPNHLHGILVITDPIVGAQHAAPLQMSPHMSLVVPLDAPRQQEPRSNARSGALGTIVRSFKSAATRRINQLRNSPSAPFWQRNYWEHIIRNEQSLNRIREYIQNNAARWAEDQLHPHAAPSPFRQRPPG